MTHATEQTALRELTITGQPQSIASVVAVARRRATVKIDSDPAITRRMQKSIDAVHDAVQQGQPIYGVTTGFGGMVNEKVSADLALESQRNLLIFLAAGAGPELDPRHVRAAMLLRANMLLQGCSGVRLEVVDRLIQFLSADAIPVVKKLGSIGASGDLIPLATIARAITGDMGRVRIEFAEQRWNSQQVLQQLKMPPLKLQPKEALAIINGTSFSCAVAANAVHESTQLLALSMAAQCMMLRALDVNTDPYQEFVHRCKPHPGQVWAAKMVRQLLSPPTNERNGQEANVGDHIQDQYSLRCLPQYMGSLVDILTRVRRTVETEMNAVTDNPLIDPAAGRLYQSGNFLGQYVGIAMDDLRRCLGLMAKHLDVQIATLVSPEYNRGLTPSLRGNNQRSYNMGLKGLQIAGNSIMPLLTYFGNPLVEHFPTHAEQFNQNINGLSWGAANLAWDSVQSFQQYCAIALIFAVQSLDLRSQTAYGHFNGRRLLGDTLGNVYDSVCHTLDVDWQSQQPLLFNDDDRWLEQDIESLVAAIQTSSPLIQSVQPIVKSFCDSIES